MLLSEQYRKDTASFNLFTVLRSGSDEVNLHSRFLHALLDHGTGDQRKNLEAFLKLKCLKLRKGIVIDSKEAKVHREKRDIDLLVTDESSKCALVIENKIYAGDQRKQLRRYYCDSELKSFRRHVIYLTLDGHEPTADSQEGVPKKHLSCVSYAALDRWLQGCHDRADDEPELRSSIAQYRKLIHNLTGGGLGDARMQQLKKLIRETGSLRLAKDVGKAADEVQVDVVGKLWRKIERAVKQAGFPEEFIKRTPPSATDPDRIKQSLGLKKPAPTKWHGLYFSRTKFAKEVPSGRAPALGVEINGGSEFFFGVRCQRDGGNNVTPDEGAYDAVEKAVASSRYAAEFRRGDHPWWPCWRYVLPDSPTLTVDQLARLSDSGQRKDLAREIAQQLKQLWDLLQKDDGAQKFF